MKIAVLGAGITGITISARLAKEENIQIDLYEKSDRLGGIIRDVNKGDINFDIGAFFLTENKNFRSLFPEYTEYFGTSKFHQYLLNPNRNIQRFPPQIKQYYKDFGAGVFLVSVIEILLNRLLHFSNPEKDFKTFIKYYPGLYLSNKSGLLDYIKRFMKANCNELDIEFGKTRLSFLKSLTIKNILKRFKKKKPATGKAATRLISTTEGYGPLFKYLKEKLYEYKVNLIMQSDIKAIEKTQEGFQIETEHESKTYDKIISTIPLDELSRIYNTNLTVPQSLNLFSLFYIYKGKLPENIDTMVNFNEKGKWKKITFFDKYANSSGIPLTVEGTFCDNKDSISTDDFLEQMSHDFLASIVNSKLQSELMDFRGGAITNNAYPHLTKANFEKAQKMISYFEEEGLILAGRQGRFWYLSSYTCMNHGLQVAENVLKELQN